MVYMLIYILLCGSTGVYICQILASCNKNFSGDFCISFVFPMEWFIPAYTAGL